MDVEKVCWFCGSSSGTLVWDSKQGTYVHPTCIREILIDDPNDEEANSMKYLLFTP